MTKKRWPTDAVMIVASRYGEERREWMESVQSAYCRDCGCQLAVDGKTIRAAVDMPERRGRPIRFFCVRCHTLYDLTTITAVIDHRGPKSTLIP